MSGRLNWNVEYRSSTTRSEFESNTQKLLKKDWNSVILGLFLSLGLLGWIMTQNSWINKLVNWKECHHIYPTSNPIWPSLLESAAEKISSISSSPTKTGKDRIMKQKSFLERNLWSSLYFSAKVLKTIRFQTLKE